MVVHPKQGSSQGSGQTHILSGGERSYSTVAFLHSLWQVMEYPFYFLDEFDVFMVRYFHIKSIVRASFAKQVPRRRSFDITKDVFKSKLPGNRYG